MKQEIHQAFDYARCGQELKERTRDRVISEMERRRAMESGQESRLLARLLRPLLPSGQGRPAAAPRMKLALSLACLLVFTVSGFGGYRLYYTEAAIISIDINPSIELGINRWGRVVEEIPYGKDGETVLKEVSLRHLEYEEALERLLTSSAMQDYLKKDALLSVTLESSDGGGLVLENLQACVDTALKQCHSRARTEYTSVDTHLCQEAHSHGISVGKYYAIQELLTVDPQATLEEFKDKSMKEIKGHTEHCEHRMQRSGGMNAGETRPDIRPADTSQPDTLPSDTWQPDTLPPKATQPENGRSGTGTDAAGGACPGHHGHGNGHH